MDEKTNKFYIVNGDQLKKLIYSDIILEALEYGGVDNWEWYNDSIKDFLDNILGANKYSYNNEGIEILVEKEIETYEPFRKI